MKIAPERDVIQRHYLISGHVQGVGYRRFAEREAKKHGLKGSARNLRDGRVEILAAGEKLTLETFEAALSRGPMLSSVSEIAKREIGAEASGPWRSFLESDFGVARDGEEPWL